MICQIFSIAFQLAGAIILLLWCLQGARLDNVIEKYFPGSNIAKRDDENNCVLEKGRLRKISRDIYINIFAFFDLIVGYSLSFYDTSNESKTKALLITMLITFIIIGIEYLISHVISICRFKANLTVKYDELEKFNVDTDITNKELDDMLSEVLKNDINCES